MPPQNQLRTKLINKLKELFQLDKPDLDFGFYRIMHAKADQVTEFIDKDLLDEIKSAFGEVDETNKQQLEAQYQHEFAMAKEYGVANPEESPKVKRAKAELDKLTANNNQQAEVYDHLYRFFERYYDKGDFISLRYYAKENNTKAAPYAIPYNGEEVKLHWANADQYYIKTSESFNNFSFDINNATEIKSLKPKESYEMEQAPFNYSNKSLKIHFRIIDTNEGEHNNVKLANKQERFFKLYENRPIELNSQGELVVNFEYKSTASGDNKVDAHTEKLLKDKYGKSLNKKDMPNNLAMAETIIDAVTNLDNSMDYLTAIQHPAPTEKVKNRPLIVKYINQYTAKNTMDYFIHKDLGGFLARELDFYLKNEVMNLDNIADANAEDVTNYLAKLKVIRKIATKLIAFLAQLENFQKKLWLKKKFVTATNYCISLDRIDAEFYSEIAKNTQQHDEWLKLFAIDELPNYSKSLTVDFLQQNTNLVLDTVFFSKDFTAKLIATIDNFDEQCDGLLIHSENFQALNLLQERYREQIKCVYIDPPYNAQSSEIPYKNTYKHSSWLSLMNNRIECSKVLFKNNFVYISAIDEVENFRLGLLHLKQFPSHQIDTISIVHNPTGQQGKNFSFTHDFAHFIYPINKALIGLENRNSSREANPDIRPLRNVSSGKNHLRKSAKNCFYPIYVKNGLIIGFGDVCSDNFHPKGINVSREDGTVEVYPIDPSNIESKWVFARDTVESIIGELSAEYNKNKQHWDIIRKKQKFRYKSLWFDKRYSANSWGSAILNKILPNNAFAYPKSIYTVMDCIDAGMSNHSVGKVLDYFAGSGTTGHATINLNREDGGKRKYILVEMGDYFNTVLKPRIQKVVYANDWKDGKPKTRDTGISHCFKYIRLESYEDSLNNLEFKDDVSQQLKNNKPLHSDYMLNYMLDIDTSGSQSLLNIDEFKDPTNYKLKIKQPNSDQLQQQKIDLIETFNYLIGLRLINMAAPQSYDDKFKFVVDEDLPEDQQQKLIIDGKIKSTTNGKWWFRVIEGTKPQDKCKPNESKQLQVLIIWRKLTGDLEQDNLMLDEFFNKRNINTKDKEYDIIYVNGSHNLDNLKQEQDHWKVRLIEEEFHQQMWNIEGAV